MGGFDIITDFQTGVDRLDVDPLSSGIRARGILVRDDDGSFSTVGGRGAGSLRKYIDDHAEEFFVGVDSESGDSLGPDDPIPMKRYGIALVNGKGDLFVFIDTNGNGDFDESGDMVIRLTGVTASDIAITDFI